MKINFTDYDLENFLVKPGIFCGISAMLIQPQFIGTKFSQKNKIFRSSIWDLDGNLISASFPKFVNFGENPENFPIPDNLNNSNIMLKVDGSCAIWDYVNDILSIRTRGTFTYQDLDNSYDFEYVREKYPALVGFLIRHPEYSVLTEIVTPNLKVVLNYPEVDIYLIGIVNKNDYSLLTQSELDEISLELGIKRPDRFSYRNIDELLQGVVAWVGQEGIVLYTDKDQHLLKIKSDWYKKLHAAKENFRSIEHVLDAWLVLGKLNYTEFIAKLAETYDFETAMFCQGFASKISEAKKEVDRLLLHMQSFVDNLKVKFNSRKDQALAIIKSYGDTNRSAFCFKLLDGKELDREDYKKLMFQVLKK